MAEINLAPGSEYLGFSRKRRRRTYGLAISIAAISALVWGGLFVFEQRLIRDKRGLERRRAALEAEITRLSDQGRRVTLFERRLTAVDSLLSEHIAWDPFLQDVERLLPPPVVVNHLKVSLREGTIELTGEAPDSDVVAQTIASLVSTEARPTIFTSGILQSISRVPQVNPAGEIISLSYKFAVNLTFDPSQLRYGR